MDNRVEPLTAEWTGLTSLRNNIIFWGIVGIVCAVARPIPWNVILGVLCGGVLLGAVCARYLYQMKTAWIDRTRFVGFAMLVIALAASGKLRGGIQYLAAGSFFSVAISAGLWVFGLIALKKLNEKLSRRAPHFGKTEIQDPPVQPDQQSTRRVFLDALPEPLRSEMSETFVTVTAIEPQSPSSELALDASSLGGAPLLASGEVWPTREGRSLDFLAQINLAEVAAFLPDGMPRSGLLSFFYDSEQPWGGDAEELGSARILHAPGGAEVTMAESSGKKLSTRQALEFRQGIAQYVPDDLDGRFYSYFRSLPEEPKAVLSILHDRVMELEFSENRLLSAPYLIQNEIMDELVTAARAYGLPAETPWTMILQLGSVSEQGWCWGDAGCIYFWLPSADLAEGCFDRPWVVLQCS